MERTEKVATALPLTTNCDKSAGNTFLLYSFIWNGTSKRYNGQVSLREKTADGSTEIETKPCGVRFLSYREAAAWCLQQNRAEMAKRVQS